MKDALLTLAATCHGDGPAGGCPILEALARPEDDGPDGSASAEPGGRG
jgi:hypothetical protein